MEEWTTREFEAHCQKIEMDREQKKIEKDMIRNMTMEDAMQKGFSDGFRDGMLAGMCEQTHSNTPAPLSHE